MENEKPRTPVSSRKLAANRENAKRSTGPRTESGKQRASENSYKHGFYARTLFPDGKTQKEDLEEYNHILRAYCNHYRPVGDLEELSVEQIAVQSMRLSRVLGHDAKMLLAYSAFDVTSLDKVVRYESNISRQLEKTIARLEQLQQERKAAEPNPSEDASEEQADSGGSTQACDPAPEEAKGSN